MYGNVFKYSMPAIWSSNAALPIVIVSASSQAQGRSGFLSKPLRREVLLQEIGQQLGLQWQARKANLRLGALDGDVLERLRAATELGRIDEVEASLHEVRRHQPELAARLEEMAGKFDYDGILELVGEVGV